MYPEKLRLVNSVIKYQISQALYSHWKDQRLKYGHQAFETKNINKKEQLLENENHHLKQIIGDLTIELKKASISIKTEEILIRCKKKCYDSGQLERFKVQSSLLGLLEMLGFSLLPAMKACSDPGMKQIFTSWSNPKGNADTERSSGL